MVKYLFCSVNGLKAWVLIVTLGLTPFVVADEAGGELGGELKVSLTGIKKAHYGRRLYLALHQVQESTEWAQAPYRELSLSPDSENVHFSVEGVPLGRYAIRLYQDLNDNQQMDSTERGMPLEPFAFSAVKKIRKYPRIDQAAFEITKGENQMILKLRHPRTKKSKRKF